MRNGTTEIDTPPSPRAAGSSTSRSTCSAQCRRRGKAAFIDDADRLSYGALAERARACRRPARAGLKREERVLLLMLDGNDWPVSFLGARRTPAWCRWR